MKFFIFTLVLVIHEIYSQEIGDVEIDTVLESLGNSLSEISNKIQLPADVGFNISEILAEYNYPLESYEVTTDDGYIITLHRIPNGRNTNVSYNNEIRKPAALFVPGLLCSSIDWVSYGPNSSLALLMADLGYDVWLINTRGSRYSENHKTLNISEAAFWDFSFHEKGFYDIPASIDFIINTTGLSQITLIGFSEGTSGSLAFAITRPEYNEKLNLLVLLSPIGYMGGVRSPLLVLVTKYLKQIQLIFNDLNIHGFPYSETFSKDFLAVCETDQLQVCDFLLQLVCGYDFDELDLDYLALLISDKPNGVSVKQLVHYGQEIVTASFMRYDYGNESENIIHYGTPIPPAYDPSLITAPVAAYYGKNDFLSGVSDVEHLLEQISNIADAYLIEDEKFNHLDFIAAKDVKVLLYDRILSVIAKYSSNIN